MTLITALTTISTAAAPFGQKPVGSLASLWVLAAIIVTIIVGLFQTCWTVNWKRRAIVSSFICALLVVAAAWTSMFTYVIADGARADAEQKAWGSKVDAWAKDVYGVDAGADDLFQTYDDCPTANACYTGKVLIGHTLTAVTLVFIGDRTILVTGDGGSQKEIPRVNGE